MHKINSTSDLTFLFIFFSSSTASALRVKRQDSTTAKTEESFEKELCKDKDAGEWFRLVAGDGDACRDVIQCTSSVSLNISQNDIVYLFLC